MFMWSPQRRKFTALSLEPNYCLSFLSGTSLASSSICAICYRTSSCLGVSGPRWLPSHHTQNRIRRERNAFSGLTPAGEVSDHLSPVDKAFLWRTIVLPTLNFGCGAVYMRSVDIDLLEITSTVALYKGCP